MYLSFDAYVDVEMALVPLLLSIFFPLVSGHSRGTGTGVLSAVLGPVNVAMGGWYCELAQPDSTANVPIKATAAKLKREPLGSLNVM